MSIGELGTPPAIPERRRPLAGKALLDRVAIMVAKGCSASQIAQRARIPYAHATKLKDELFAQIFQGVATEIGPDALKSMKTELTETLLEEIHNCKVAVKQSIRAGKPNTRPYTALNSAAKLLNGMWGLNAPTQIETTDRKVFALVNPAVHRLIMADPRAREALVLLEEFAAIQRDAGDEPDEVIIDVLPAEGTDEP